MTSIDFIINGYAYGKFINLIMKMPYKTDDGVILYNYECQKKAQYANTNKIKQDILDSLEMELEILYKKIISELKQDNEITDIIQEISEIQNNMKTFTINHIIFEYEYTFKNLLISKLMEILHYNEKPTQEMKNNIYNLMYSTVNKICNDIFIKNSSNNNINFICEGNNINIMWKICKETPPQPYQTTARRLFI